MNPFSLIKDDSFKSNIDPPSTTPQLVGDYGSYFYYYIATRDPTDTEPDIYSDYPYINIFWWNTTTNDWFLLIDDTAVSYTWLKLATDSNFNSLLPVNLQNTSLNSSRSFSNITSPAFNTSYQPNLTHDTMIIANVQLNSVLAGSASATAQVNTGAGFITLGTASISGIAATNDQLLSFIVPAAANFQILSATSGIGSSTSLLSIQQLAL